MYDLHQLKKKNTFSRKLSLMTLLRIKTSPTVTNLNCLQLVYKSFKLKTEAISAIRLLDKKSLTKIIKSILQL